MFIPFIIWEEALKDVSPRKGGWDKASLLWLLLRCIVPFLCCNPRHLEFPTLLEKLLRCFKWAYINLMLKCRCWKNLLASVLFSWVCVNSERLVPDANPVSVASHLVDLLLNDSVKSKVECKSPSDSYPILAMWMQCEEVAYIITVVLLIFCWIIKTDCKHFFTFHIHFHNNKVLCHIEFFNVLLENMFPHSKHVGSSPEVML